MDLTLEVARKDILAELDKISTMAAKLTTCLRKGVGCALMEIGDDYLAFPIIKYNGPTHEICPCTNVVGNCGCMHSEIKVIIEALRQGLTKKKYVLLSTYSPCTNCANMIIQSGIVQGVIFNILTEHDKRGAEFLRKFMPVLTAYELSWDLIGASQEIKDAQNVIFRTWQSANRTC